MASLRDPGKVALTLVLSMSVSLALSKALALSLVAEGSLGERTDAGPWCGIGVLATCGGIGVEGSTSTSAGLISFLSEMTSGGGGVGGSLLMLLSALCCQCCPSNRSTSSSTDDNDDSDDDDDDDDEDDNNGLALVLVLPVALPPTMV